jgi:hypothetical protein
MGLGADHLEQEEAEREGEELRECCNPRRSACVRLSEAFCALSLLGSLISARCRN